MINLKTPPNLQEVKKLAPKAKAFLFDMDGTLLKSENIHAEGLLAVITKFPGQEDNTMTALDLEHKYLGIADNDVFQLLKNDKLLSLDLSLTDYLDNKNKLMLQILKENPEKLVLHDCIFKLLDQMKNDNYLMAVVTASEKEITLPFLKAAGMEHYFSTIVTNNDVTHSKPHPAPYLQAMKELNIRHEEAFIFEDSPTGLESAKSSQSLYCQVSWFA